MRLRASVWLGWLITLPRGGWCVLATFRSLTIPFSHLHMDTHKHCYTHGRIFRPHQHHQHRQRHLPGPWVEDMWPAKMHHDAGLTLTDLLLACLPESSQPGTAHRNRGVCFPLWLRRSPSALCSPQLLGTVECCRSGYKMRTILLHFGFVLWVCAIHYWASLTFPRIDCK